MLRYGEIFLKGKNRAFFEKKLADNIKKITGVKEIKKLRSRFVTEYFGEHGKLRSVFGLTSYSLSFYTEKDEEKIKEKALEILKDKGKTFRIETKRSDKTFPLKSLEMNVLVGEFIEKNSNLKFSFENSDNILKIEINQNGAYLFFDTVECFGGLPTGVEGKVFLLVENEASLLAGLLFMKRGCSLLPIAFEDRDTSLLQEFSPSKLKLNVIKDLNGLKGNVLVSGQSFKHFKKYNGELTVMRPLIAFSDKRIKEKLGEFKL